MSEKPLNRLKVVLVEHQRIAELIGCEKRELITE